MSMVVLAVIVLGTDISMTPTATMDKCLDNARRVATVADWGNAAKEPRAWSVECKHMDIWINS